MKNQQKIKEHRQRAFHLLGECRRISEKAEAEKRALTAEEQSAYDRQWNELAAAKAAADRLEREDQAEAEFRASAAEPVTQPEPGTGVPARTEPAADRRDLASADDKELRAAFSRALDVGERRLSAEEASLVDEFKRRAFRSYLVGGRANMDGLQQRALSAGSDPDGGYIVAPKQFVGELIEAVDDILFLLGKASVHQAPNAESLGIPSLDTDPADPVWTAEVATGDEDSSMAFGGRELKPHPLAKRIKVSRKLMRMATVGGKTPEGLVNERFAYKFGRVLENALLNGSGAGQPLGLFTASDLGIGTGRDISTGNSATAIGADNLREMKYGLKAQYMNRAEWIWHRDALKQISKLKDGDGQYLWQPGISAADPDRLLNLPINMSELAPNTFTTGKYVGLLGVLSFLHVAISLNFELQRLEELYAESNQVGFIGRLEADGMPVLAEAFVRSKLA